jgi:chromate transporter
MHQQPPVAAPSLREILYVFARYGNLTFGGGSATIATLHGEVVERLGWIAQHRFDLVYALSRLTPGTNLLAFGTAVGWMLRGWPGAVTALVGGSVPCSLLALALTVFFQSWSTNQAVQIALKGAVAAAVGVMFFTSVTIIRPHWKSASSLKLAIFVGGSLAAASLLSISPLRILLASALLGFFWPAKAAAKE